MCVCCAVLCCAVLCCAVCVCVCVCVLCVCVCVCSQEVLVWITEMQSKLGASPSESDVAQYVRDTLSAGRVSPVACCWLFIIIIKCVFRNIYYNALCADTCET